MPGKLRQNPDLRVVQFFRPVNDVPVLLLRQSLNDEASSVGFSHESSTQGAAVSRNFGSRNKEAKYGAGESTDGPAVEVCATFSLLGAAPAG